MTEKQRLTESTLGSLFGCCELFPLCTDGNLMSLVFRGQDKFLDWLGWELTDVCRMQRGFLNYIRPARSEGRQPSVGYLADPCADPAGVDFGVCDFTLEDFARLRRGGPVRDITYSKTRFCETTPRWFLDGSPVESEDDLSRILAMEVILQDFKRMLITGNAATPGQFSGLNTLIKTGYTDSQGHPCQLMDSNVIEWAGNDLSGDGGGAMDWNGHVIPAGTDFINALLAVSRRINQRIGWSAALAARRRVIGDQVIVLPTFLRDCLLDAFACWSVCPGREYNEVNISSREAIAYREGLNGGTYGDGRIYLDGFEIPLIAYDWETMHGNSRGDVYFLTGHLSGLPLLYGQMHNLTAASSGGVVTGWMEPLDGGRVLTWRNPDHTCVQWIVEMQPRLVALAPWAQARFQNVECAPLGGVISPDPDETSFFPDTSFNSAPCLNS